MSHLPSELADEQQTSDQKAIFGFWVYLMTDGILFSALFATYAVLHNNTYGGPTGGHLFNLPGAFVETLILLTSSFTCGLAMLAVRQRAKRPALFWFGLTLILGLAFLIMEVSEFHHLAATGNSWTRSGFLSSFFTLVSTHGLHITIGLLWLVAMMAKIARNGFSRATIRRLTMFSYFWHFLDIIWVFIFTVVYLMSGAMR
ncbi:MAG: cytochrome o ubiquinol oxidase subunit III [Candidatus Saccharimonadales bacterium]